MAPTPGRTRAARNRSGPNAADRRIGGTHGASSPQGAPASDVLDASPANRGTVFGTMPRIRRTAATRMDGDGVSRRRSVFRCRHRRWGLREDRFVVGRRVSRSFSVFSPLVSVLLEGKAAPCMPIQSILLTHEHVYLGDRHDHRERRTWAVVGVTAAMMVVEIVGGTLYGSMALVADGGTCPRTPLRWPSPLWPIASPVGTPMTALHLRHRKARGSGGLRQCHHPRDDRALYRPGKCGPAVFSRHQRILGSDPDRDCRPRGQSRERVAAARCGSSWHRHESSRPP